MDDKINFCARPFEQIEIYNNGDVFTCCPNWNNRYSIGNLNEQSFDEIWNSDKVVDLRTRILNGDYSLCNVNNCTYLKQKIFNKKYDTECKAVMEDYPKVIKFSYDYECNIVCRICCNQVKRMSDEELEKYNSKIDSFFLPLLKSAKILTVTSSGDPFAARHSRLLIKKAAEKYKDLRFDFPTNGLLCNERIFKSMNLTLDRIYRLRISLHAATPETYSKIVVGGEKFFNKIIENIKKLSPLQKKYNFEIFLHFVITSKNYKEIPAFLKLSEKLGVTPALWEFYKTQCEYDIDEDDWSIVNKNHPEYDEFLKVLDTGIVIKYKKNFSPSVFDLIEKFEYLNKRGPKLV